MHMARGSASMEAWSFTGKALRRKDGVADFALN